MRAFRNAPFFTIKFSAPEPSVPKTKSPISHSPPSADINVAAAASPNKVLLPLSFSLINLLYISEVINNTFLAILADISPFAKLNPYTKPEHPKLKSNAPILFPSLSLS
ncbi:hypothetical protein D3C80_1495070 [compost metagenome]